MRRAGAVCLAGLAVLLAPWPAVAHPLAPALLELREAGGGRIEVTWKTSVLRAPGIQVEPVLPPECRPLSAPRAEVQGEAVVATWAIDCGAAGLVGRRVGVEGLGEARIDALVRASLADGRVVRAVVRAADPYLTVPAREERSAILRAYIAIGIEHILTGLDHLLFIAGLLLLVRTRRLLIETVTAFTVGHSITLSLAVLDVVRLPSGPIELLIACSVFWLAVELARDPEARPSLVQRRPWLMALAFGLLHGLGFASALQEVGLPQADLPLALLAFNLGIEIGQLAFVALWLSATALLRRVPARWPAWAAQVPLYVMGTLAAFWCFERAAALLR